MTHPTKLARAPGKIMLAGEYAVLEGHPALVLAVDRFAVARPGTAPQTSPFLQAARRLWTGSPSGAAILDTIAIDTSELRHESGTKLGLGSSAAATVAGLALAMAEDGPLDHAAVHALAHRAHGDAQAALGARGSGADIAASVWGGLVEVQPASSAEQLPRVRTLDRGGPQGLTLAGGAIHLLAVWTGRAADTRNLVAAVATWARSQPAGYRRRIDALAAAAGQLGRAIAQRDGAGAVTAVAQGCAALAALARDSGVPLLPEGLETVADRARSAGASVKPTGAGGGDLLLVCGSDGPAVAELAAELGEIGMKAVDMRVDPHGAHIVSDR